MKEKEVQEVYDELIASYKNLKAEVFVCEVLEKSNLEFTDIDVFNKSTFTRSYRRDVISFIMDSYSESGDKLQLNLARNGLYDLLPEGIFHEPIKTKTNVALSYKHIRQKHKKEEKEARSFFTPIENELFVQKVRIEQNERVLIDEFTNLKNDFLLDFWGLDKEIPRDYNIKLLQLLPFAHKISGDTELMAIGLENIIEEQVKIKTTTKSYHDVDSAEGEDKLGVDFVLELTETTVVYPMYKITIGPIERKNADKFLKNGITTKFISIFCDYFVPIEIDAEINIVYLEEESEFVLDAINSPRMGLTTTI
ncbi:hypothetical protein [Aquimarina longa]|uniref:hypothetical protein n=1 Tax=Aquimarina longa TaxID=1080221 RepID=UPI000781833B|nr:hypothetical protein [Aquimarina longa]